MPHQAGSDPGRSGPSWGGWGGIHSPASVLLPQVPNRLWRTGNWRVRGGGLWLLRRDPLPCSRCWEGAWQQMAAWSSPVGGSW